MLNPRAFPAPERAPAILILDDDVQVLRSVSRMLGLLGYAPVFQASSCEQALEIWKMNAGEITLLISDFVMPGKTGDLIAADMRKDKPSLQVLFISGNDPHSLDSIIPLECGFNFLQKPFSVSDMQRILGRLALSA